MGQHERLLELRAEYVAAEKAKKKGTVSRIEATVVEENTPLVHKIVGKLIKRLTGPRYVPDDDLLQAGKIGMLRAWKGWKPEKGRFSTYAAHWIRHEFQGALGDEAPIYKPHGVGKTWQVYREQERIRARTGREATAEELGVTQEQLDKWNNLPTITHMEDTEGNLNSHFAMDGAGGRMQVEETAAYADKKPNAHEALEFAEMAHSLGEALGELSEKERYVITQLFIEEKSYEDVAAALEVTDSRIHQIRASAQAKLRAKVQRQ